MLKEKGAGYAFASLNALISEDLSWLMMMIQIS